MAVGGTVSFRWVMDVSLVEDMPSNLVQSILLLKCTLDCDSCVYSVQLCSWSTAVAGA
jgi:hypothetical protein